MHFLRSTLYDTNSFTQQQLNLSSVITKFTSCTGTGYTSFLPEHLIKVVSSHIGIKARRRFVKCMWCAFSYMHTASSFQCRLKDVGHIWKFNDQLHEIWNRQILSSFEGARPFTSIWKDHYALLRDLSILK